MNKLFAMVASGALSVGGVALVGPELGLFGWTRDLPDTPQTEIQTAAEVSPATDTDKPSWAEKALARLEADVASHEDKLEKLREIQRRKIVEASEGWSMQRPPTQQIRVSSSGKAPRVQEARDRLKKKKKAQQNRRPPGPVLRAFNCMVSGPINGKSTFKFRVSNSSEKYVKARASIYLLEHSPLTGTYKALAKTVSIEVRPKDTQVFSRSYVIVTKDRSPRCEVKLKVN